GRAARAATWPSRGVVDGAALVAVERRVLHDRERARPARSCRLLLDSSANPVVRARGRCGELVERERLADALPELVCVYLQLGEQARERDGIPQELFEAAVALLPLLADGVDRRHGRRLYSEQQVGGQSGSSSRTTRSPSSAAACGRGKAAA